MAEKITLDTIIPDELGGLRLDQAIGKLLPNCSRTQIQDWIKNEEITLNGKPTKAKVLVIGGEIVHVDAAQKAQPVFKAQPIALNIVYEDDDLLVINKAAGMVVHPAAGNYENTLLNALLHHAPSLKDLPRAGILHRLDKETTGLLVIAKTSDALHNLSKQLKERTISRIYQAIALGTFLSGGTIDAPIGRHPIARKRMAIMDNGKPAITHYRLVDRYRAHTRLKVKLETGRTHQIRVHMAHIQHPLLGDPVYGGRLQIPKGASPELVLQLRGFKRQALHASELGLIHPRTQKKMVWHAPIPADMQLLIDTLKNDADQLNNYDY